MSGRSRNFAPAPDQESPPWDFFDVAPPSPAVLPRAVSYRTTPPGLTRTRPFVPERAMSQPTPSSLAGFTTPLSPFILLEDVYAMPRAIVHEPPPRSIGQPNAPVLSEQDSTLTGDEQKKVLSKLKKEIYNPLPKRFIRRVSLYYRENARNGLRDQNRYRDDDDGKRCAICLDDFEPKEEVMVTPCDHMFHEDCIVPWLRGHSQCPVCRFSLLEQKRQAQPPAAPVAFQHWEATFYVPEALLRQRG